jgi:hypothetical protein
MRMTSLLAEVVFRGGRGLAEPLILSLTPAKGLWGLGLRGVGVGLIENDLQNLDTCQPPLRKCVQEAALGLGSGRRSLNFLGS